MTTSTTVKIVNKLGMHARAAALFVKSANLFEAEIFVTKGKHRVNGKSIMGLLMLAAPCGSRITVEASGPDASSAIKRLVSLVAKGFNEK
ncbi:MAG: HPr family phosphocarrier protein [Deltaproteobacteria bacterium]|nr:HPr family phosphocarrier protein [Deltaproteobacteria bacterium]